MKFLRAAGLFTILLAPVGRLWAQEPQPSGQAVIAATPEEQSTSLIRLLPRIATEQKRIWTFPVAAAHGKGWKPALIVLTATVALVALDPVDSPYFQSNSFQQSPAVHRINHVLSGPTTSLAIAVVPVSFYLGGLLAKDSYASQTALLAGEAVANAAIVTLLVKDISRRMLPGEVRPNGNLSDTWFDTNHRSAGGFGSFPSGHAAAAFAVATVFAERYRHHRWVPFVAYGLAGVVAFSRLSNQAHFPSDIFMGAALGSSISHFAVLR